MNILQFVSQKYGAWVTQKSLNIFNLSVLKVKSDILPFLMHFFILFHIFSHCLSCNQIGEKLLSLHLGINYNKKAHCFSLIYLFFSFSVCCLKNKIYILYFGELELVFYFWILDYWAIISCWITIPRVLIYEPLNSSNV